ncbi:MAG TPA: alkaline phosphatase family protein [Candidatus Dormibacteraeota bacterium]|nr:alkaline phosphatase family protein [Candidatus Dormibacteraeota bacterium]
MVILEENREYNSVIGAADAPYINSLAQQYVLSTNWFGVHHPSLPNYLALISGSTQGINDDGTGYVFNGTNLADQLSNAGISWKAYMEDMPSPCDNTGGTAGYAKKHDPFMYFSDITSNPARCNRVVPFTQFNSDLTSNTAPNFMWVTPNLCNDGHDCGNNVVDGWLQSEMAVIQGSQWYAQGGKVIITYDEGDTGGGLNGTDGGHIVTITVSNANKGHGQNAASGDHYGTLRAIEEAYGLGLLAGAADARNGDLRTTF